MRSIFWNIILIIKYLIKFNETKLNSNSYWIKFNDFFRIEPKFHQIKSKYKFNSIQLYSIETSLFHRIKKSRMFFFFENTCELKIKIKLFPKDVFEVLYFSTTKWTPLQLWESKPKKRKWKNRLWLVCMFLCEQLCWFQ